MARLICAVIIGLFFQLLHADESSTSPQDSRLVIGLLHFAPEAKNLQANTQAIAAAMAVAKAHGVHWLLTPELAITGYHFHNALGTDWIPAGPDTFVQRIQEQARNLEIGVLLSHLERPLSEESAIFNTLFVIDATGEIIARHRKINTIPRSEAWSTKGDSPTLVSLSGYQAGLLICADAWPFEHANRLKEQGAELILSSANWAPGQYGPGDTWEQRSLETRLPVIVNNRTGIDDSLDLREAASVVSVAGKRVFEHASEQDSLILLHWERTQPSPTLLRAQTIIIAR
ncbi:MAG TPA: carbon-nitrogen hydrolase family protein [Gammaproteobacteria bacterium]|jgi:predicted amidohydrolase|nr:carbon-nitrogen hydrolase family protein [Gammaproteobacteria bacterium]